MNNRLNITTTEPFKRMLGAALGLILALASALTPAYAHGGFDHVLGTVAKVADNALTVKTARGDVEVKLDKQTELTMSGHKAQLADLKVGDRVVVDLPKGSKIAHAVKIGVASKTADPHVHRSTAK